MVIHRETSKLVVLWRERERERERERALMKKFSLFGNFLLKIPLGPTKNSTQAHIERNEMTRSLLSVLSVCSLKCGY